MKCAVCEDKSCYNGRDCTKIKKEVLVEYNKKSNQKVMSAASSIEAEGYMKLTRLEELMVFCKQMGYEKLGLAFCIGLEDEAKTIHEIISRDFELSSVCCKVCGVSKKEHGFKLLEGGGKSACNPLGQAKALNSEETQLNIILGLCVGHDILFTEYSKAPVTTLAVKDRVLTHNPLAAIYSRYYKKRGFNLK